MRSKVGKEAPPNAPAQAIHQEDGAPPGKDQAPNAGNRQSLSEIAYERLSDMLRSRNLQPNDLINERRLALQLNVSRTPLREAIRRLEGEKILERQGSGTLVVKPISIEDFLYICQVRRLIEGEAARRAAGRISVPDLVRQRQRYIAYRSHKTPIRKTEPEASRDLHRWIAEACGNPVLASIIIELKNRSKLFRLGVPERFTCDEHLPIIDALIKGNGDEAKAAMQRHIDGVRTYALEQLGAL
jgi:DNA-binding GntR family transcriptional regulator